ncbi:type II secretion system protein GspG [Bradyrhizobium sp. sGM-13]|uniref:type II secretion system protein GspG n=1 Tax=Bradyrhizobium sp. sGM-13 TaxID=2831781 RepID=UPI0035C854B1
MQQSLSLEGQEPAGPLGRQYQYAYPASSGEYEVYSLGPTGKANSASAAQSSYIRSAGS